MRVLCFLIVASKARVSFWVRTLGGLCHVGADRTSLAGFAFRSPASVRNRKNDRSADFDRLMEIVALGLPDAA